MAKRITAILTCAGMTITIPVFISYAAINEKNAERKNSLHAIGRVPVVSAVFDVGKLNPTDLVKDLHEHWGALSSYIENPQEFAAQFGYRMETMRDKPDQVFVMQVLDGVLTWQPTYSQVRNHILQGKDPSDSASTLRQSILNNESNNGRRHAHNIAMTPLRQTAAQITSLHNGKMRRVLGGLFEGEIYAPDPVAMPVDDPTVAAPAAFDVGALDPDQLKQDFRQLLSKVKPYLRDPPNLAAQLSSRISAKGITSNQVFAIQILMESLCDQEALRLATP